MGTNVKYGGVVSLTVIVCTTGVDVPQPSVTVYVRVIVPLPTTPPFKLVTSLWLTVAVLPA
jgi:hypothetical protein